MRLYKAFGKGLLSAEIMVVLVGSAWAGFFPDHMKRVFDASPGNALVLFIMAAGLLVFIVTLASSCGAWLWRAWRSNKS